MLFCRSGQKPVKVGCIPKFLFQVNDQFIFCFQYVKAMTDSAICPVAKISAYLDLLSEKGLTFSRGPIFGPMHADDFSLISQYVAKAVGLAGPKAASYDHRSFQLTPLPESASAPDHDYSTINTTAPASTALDDRIKVEVIPEVLIKVQHKLKYFMYFSQTKQLRNTFLGRINKQTF